MVLKKLLTDPEWHTALADQWEMDYIKNLENFLEQEKSKGKKIYPPEPEIFQALNLCPLHEVKVLLLGQDPYHGEGQSQGLAFSVGQGVPHPPSLRNIYRELVEDLGIEIPETGSLLRWCSQGVLLLNTSLSVEASKAGSHAGKGWEILTDRIIELVNELEKPVVFLLWGGHAQKKIKLIDSKKHCILKAPHPSPLSSYRGFFGSRPFSQSNSFLRSQKREAIDWEPGKKG